MAALYTLKNLRLLTTESYLPSEGWKEIRLRGEMNSQNLATSKLKGHLCILKELTRLLQQNEPAS